MVRQFFPPYYAMLTLSQFSAPRIVTPVSTSNKRKTTKSLPSGADPAALIVRTTSIPQAPVPPATLPAPQAPMPPRVPLYAINSASGVPVVGSALVGRPPFYPTPPSPSPSIIYVPSRGGTPAVFNSPQGSAPALTRTTSEAFLTANSPRDVTPARLTTLSRTTSEAVIHLNPPSNTEHEGGYQSEGDDTEDDESNLTDSDDGDTEEDEDLCKLTFLVRICNVNTDRCSCLLSLHQIPAKRIEAGGTRSTSEDHMRQPFHEIRL